MATRLTEKKSTIREYYEALLIGHLRQFRAHLRLSGIQDPDGIDGDNLKIGDHIIVNKLMYGPAPTVRLPPVPLRDVKQGTSSSSATREA